MSASTQGLKTFSVYRITAGELRTPSLGPVHCRLHRHLSLGVRGVDTQQLMSEHAMGFSIISAGAP